MKKRRVISLIIAIAALFSALSVSVSATTNSGSGISYTTNGNHWIRRGNSSGYQYVYKPPLVDGSFAYCVDYGYSYNSESTAFLNSYTWTRATGADAADLLERAVTISGMHEYSEEVLDNVKWLMSYINQHYQLNQAELGEWLMCVQTYVWDNMSYKGYGDTSDGGQIDGGGYANPDTYEKYKRMYTDLLVIKAEEDAQLQRQIEDYNQKGIQAYVAADPDSQWAVYAVSSVSGRQGFFNYNEVRKVVVGDLPDEPDLPDAEEAVLTITKRDSITSAPLSGATYRIEGIDSGYVNSVTTGANGMAVVENLLAGSYRVFEESPPLGYLPSSEVQTFHFDGQRTINLTFTNEPLAVIELYKQDADTGEDVSAVFDVYRDEQHIDTIRVDGHYTLSGLSEGVYKFVEVSCPGNYILDPTPYSIYVEPGAAVTTPYELTVTNHQKLGLEILKLERNSLEPLNDVPFAIYHDGELYGEFATDENGLIYLNNINPGTWTAVELEADGDHLVNDTPQTIELHAGDPVKRLIFFNDLKPGVRILKLDGADLKTPIAGARFRVEAVDGSWGPKEYVTDADGIIELIGLPDTAFCITELECPGYVVDNTPRIVQLRGNEVAEFVFVNSRRPDLIIHKNDADTQQPIAGTIFLVKWMDGHTLAEVETDQDGIAVVENLTPSVVEVIEKSVPEPYLLAERSQVVTLYAGHDRDVYFENYKRPTIEIIKENEITHDRIANVPFQVWYASNDTSTGEYNDLGVFYTDEDGRIELTDPDISLRDGWFRVKELEPAPGFSIADPDTQEAFIAAGEGHTFRFYNRPLSAICVWKYDSESGEAIGGAVFQVRYLSGNTSGTGGTVIGTYRTSINGSFTVTGCKAGTYIIEELSSGGSHVIDTPPQTVYLSGEEQEVVQVYFGNSPKGSLLIRKVSAADNSPISDVQFFVTESDGTVVGNGNGYFTTDSAGTILIENIDPNTTLVVKETRAKEGFLLDDTPQTVQIKAGQTVTLEFRNKPQGNLIIHKLSSTDKTPLEGVQFKITYADGSYLPDEGGKLSSNGLYWTNSEGQIVLSNVTGTIVVTEVQSVPGYTIDPNTQSQTVVVNPDDTQELWFYNTPVGGVEIIKVNASKTSERIPDTTFEIRRMDDGLVDTITTDSNGRAFLALEDGAYYALEIESNPNFVLDDTPHYFEVKDGKVTSLCLTNAAKSGILIHKVDTNGEGIYGVKFLLYDEDRNPIGEFTSDDNGYVYITAEDLPDGANTSGRFYLRELEAAEGYILDEEYKTVYVRPGHTAEIEWVNEAITGQIQIYKYAAEYNEVTGTPAGTPLQGAVYEISNARTGKVVDYITTDARGVAASKPLPLTRYKIVEVTAPAYWQVDPTVHDVTLEYAGQIIKISAYDKPSNLGVTITKRGNTEVLAGQSMRYDLTVANTSNVPLENFYWHDKIPYDVARATTLTTGTYSARLNYRVLYKTNYQSSYQVLASNLLTSNNYSFALNAIPMQAGEVVTDIYFDFGKVPVGFQSVTGPTLSVIINGNTVNGYQLVNRADVGGKYQGTWQTAQASWVTIIRKYTTTPDLPKTGY